MEAARTYVERHLHEPPEREGVPPWTYVRGRRVDRARTLLDRGMPPPEVAYRTGFADQAHLTRVFKEATGKTPGEHRRERTNVRDGAARAAPASPLQHDLCQPWTGGTA